MSKVVLLALNTIIANGVSTKERHTAYSAAAARAALESVISPLQALATAIEADLTPAADAAAIRNVFAPGDTVQVNGGSYRGPATVVDFSADDSLRPGQQAPQVRVRTSGDRVFIYNGADIAAGVVLHAPPAVATTAEALAASVTPAPAPTPVTPPAPVVRYGGSFAPRQAVLIRGEIYTGPATVLEWHPRGKVGKEGQAHPGVTIRTGDSRQKKMYFNNDDLVAGKVIPAG